MLRLFLLPLTVVLVSHRMSDADDTAVRVMSFNIRYGTASDGENSWPHRSELVIKTIDDFAPHVLGLQEALRFQLDELRGALAHFGEAGVGRDDGREAGEYAAIFFDRRRLQLVAQGTFWFSETPQRVASTTWGNEIPRICTWARLHDKSSGKEFAVFNVHWDHVSQPSRVKSGELLRQKIATHTELPIVVTGDFNADEQNPAFRQLVADGPPGLVDSFRQIHPDARLVGTFNGFEGRQNGGKIDAVLANGRWRVLDANIVHANRDGRYPSDHFPVTATLEPAP